MSEVLLFFCVTLILYIFFKYVFERPNGFPPGPPRIPLFGSYLFMMMANFKYLHKSVLSFSKWYNSDIVGFYLGSIPVVAVHNAEGIREILFNQDFDGRPKVYIPKMRDPNYELKGIFFTDGYLWKEQRRFFLRHLRDFGFGRRFEELELVIKEEITDMLELIRNGPRYDHEEGIVCSEGYRILLPYIFSPFAANSFFYIMGNTRHPRAAQAELLELVRQGMVFQRTSDDYGKMLSTIPWIRYIFPNWSSYNTLMKVNQFIYRYFEKLVDFHIDTFDESSERNFIDLYIKEMKNANESGIEASTFSRSQFIMSLIDFALPAFTAIGSQISLLVQYFLLHPEIQDRIQHEIDDTVGSGRLPSLEDRKNMHYTEATIREILRIETLVPSDILHLALVDTELLGYKIPKNTVVVPSLYAYHRDKRVWKDPECFQPERFLNGDGHLSLEKDISFPFGAGKRLCAGETFARNMLFLMVTALCQNFTFVLGPGDVLPDPSKNLSGLIISPPDFWVQLVERS